MELPKYSNQNSPIFFPEYGRHIQDMIEYAKNIEIKEERQACVQFIAQLMLNNTPNLKNVVEFQQTIWEHIALISGYSLDIDYPFELTPLVIPTKEDMKIEYPSMENNFLSIYGKHTFLWIEYYKTITDEESKKYLKNMLLIQMKRSYENFMGERVDDSKIIEDLSRSINEPIFIDRIDDSQVDHDNNKKRNKKSKNFRK